MARTPYSYEKRQKELAKMKKKEEKRLRKLEQRQQKELPDAEGAPDFDAESGMEPGQS